VTATACLITDVQMPGLSGVQLQNHLIASGYGTPVIFVTAFPDDGVQAHVLKNGAIGFLCKPFNEDRLIECIDVALEKHQGPSAEY
jgi:FixJ family two-component response regulator